MYAWYMQYISTGCMLGISPIRVCMNGVFFPVNLHAMLNVNYTYRCMNGCLHDPKYVMHNVCILHVQWYVMSSVFICMLIPLLPLQDVWTTRCPRVSGVVFGRHVPKICPHCIVLVKSQHFQLVSAFCCCHFKMSEHGLPLSIWNYGRMTYSDDLPPSII